MAAGKEPERPESRTWPSVSRSVVVLDQRPPARSVAGDEDGCGEAHDEQQHRAERPGGDSQGAPHQKACPRPM